MGTDKVTVDVKAEADGTLVEIKEKADSTVEVGQVLAVIKLGGEPSKTAEKMVPAAAPAATPAAAPAAAPAASRPVPVATSKTPSTSTFSAPAPPKAPLKAGSEKAALEWWSSSWRKQWYG